MEIPDKCIIIFHAFLYHYGDKAQWYDHKFQANLRTFTYLREKEYLPNSHLETYQGSLSDWCNNKCDPCKSFHEILKYQRCNNQDEMVWTTKMSTSQINLLPPGGFIMGDIDYLGWAVIKSFIHPISKLVLFSNEINHLQDEFENNKRYWNNITGHKKLQFKDLCTKDENETYFKKYKGKSFIVVE